MKSNDGAPAGNGSKPEGKAASKAQKQTKAELPAFKRRAEEAQAGLKKAADEAGALLTRADGTRLTIGDVATVRDGFEDVDRSATFNGKPCVTVWVFNVGNQNVPDVARRVKEYAESAKQRMPAGVQLSLWRDDSHALQSRFDLLKRSGIAGLVLVFFGIALTAMPTNCGRRGSAPGDR